MSSFTRSRLDAMFTANKLSRGVGMSRDDSSSVSSTRKVDCQICDLGETLPTKPLITCSVRKCQRRYHPYCHKPAVDFRKLPEDWKCSHCIGKKNSAAGPSIPPTTTNELSAANSSIPLESSINMSGKLCQESGCNRLIFQNAAHVLHCNFHQIQQRYQNSIAKKPAGSLIAGTGSKPIKKKTLYSFKPDDDTKQLKRKRSSHAKKSSGYNDTETSVGEGLKVSIGQQKSHPQVPSTSALSDAFLMKPNLQRTHEQGGDQFNVPAEMERDQILAEEDLSLSLGSVSMGESPISPRNPDLDGDNLMPQSTHITPQSSGKQPPASPEYSPPPPVELQHDDQNNLWAEPGRDESLGSQIDQEIRATTDLPEDWDLQPDFVAKNGFAANQEDDEMPDLSTISVKKTGPPLNTAELQKVSISSSLPAMTSASSSTTPAESESLDAYMATEVPEIPESLEAQRKHRAVAFDTSSLDFFLAKQAELESEMQPTSQDLGRTQIWGHIDPRMVWPKDISEAEFAEKRSEIDARGGRKANFGILLTAKVRKERTEQGWQIHQTSKAVNDDKTARHMEELFGIKAIDDWVPGVRHGQLGMIEKPVDENSRKKRKPAVKFHPVI